MIPFKSNNCLIGSWNDRALQYKQALLDFVKQHRVNFQQGSINVKNDNHQRYWEYATALAFTNPRADHEGRSVRALDAGGANSLLSWYLASVDVDVISTDVIAKNVKDGENNRKHFKLLDNIEFANEDVSKGERNEEFDYVYCINVIEHVMEHSRGDKFKPGTHTYWGNNKRQYTPSTNEIKKEQLFAQGLAKALKPGGVLALTYDYKSFGVYKCQPKCAYMRGLEDVQTRIIEPSGLNIFGDGLDFTEDLTEKKRSASTGIIFLQKNAT